MSPPLLQVHDLQVSFPTSRGVARAVNGVSFSLNAGDSLGVVGESGSGKSTVALSLMRLLPTPGKVDAGHIYVNGTDVLQLTEDEMRQVRGKDLSIVFQNPMTSLNPSLTIGRQIAEPLRRRGDIDPTSVRSRVVELLDLVGIPTPSERVFDYPHRFSGGMRQRVMIAIALASNPKILIADEPTTALDVTVQAEILELIRRLQQEFGMAVIWITHDLGLVARIAERILVMYGGIIVEDAQVYDLYEKPSHPYTMGLLGALPGSANKGELISIPGSPPDPTALPLGCPFWPRCPYQADPRCESLRPPLVELEPGHSSASFYRPDEPIGFGDHARTSSG